MEAYSIDRPEFFTIERTHDNRLIVRFAENIEEIETEEGVEYRYWETIGTFPWSNSLESQIRRNPEAFLAKLKKLNG